MGIDMKDAEDEAFDDLERRQGGFQAKRAMAADKLQKFCTCHETHPMECQGCRANRLAQPAQEQWKCVGPPCKCNASNAKQCCYAVFTTPPQREWVGLTDEEAAWCQSPTVTETWKRIEAKLKEKNG
jgi:hypothetical protein